MTSNLSARPTRRVCALAISPNYAVDHTIFAGLIGGVEKSTDSGDHWALANDGVPYREVWALAISSNFAVDGTVFAGVWFGGVYRTKDGGDHWSEANEGQPNRRPGNGPTLVLSPNYATNQTLYYGTWGDGPGSSGVFRSADGGVSWTLIADGLGVRWLHFLALSPDDANHPLLLAGGEFQNGGGLWAY